MSNPMIQKGNIVRGPLLGDFHSKTRSKTLGLFERGTTYTFKRIDWGSINLIFQNVVRIDGSPGPTLTITTLATSGGQFTSSSFPPSQGFFGGISISLGLWNGQQSLYTVQMPVFNVACGENQSPRLDQFEIPLNCYDQVSVLEVAFPTTILMEHC